jgi:hypothetical protein
MLLMLKALFIAFAAWWLYQVITRSGRPIDRQGDSPTHIKTKDKKDNDNDYIDYEEIK